MSFPPLKMISGLLGVSGDIKRSGNHLKTRNSTNNRFSTELSDLTQVRDGFIINSTKPSLNCSGIKTLADLGVFRSGGLQLDLSFPRLNQPQRRSISSQRLSRVQFITRTLHQCPNWRESWCQSTHPLSF